jgi:hypothetical protein
VKRLLLAAIVLLLALGITAGIWAAGSDDDETEPCPPSRVTVTDPTTSRLMTYTNPCDRAGPVSSTP